MQSTPISRAVARARLAAMLACFLALSGLPGRFQFVSAQSGAQDSSPFQLAWSAPALADTYSVAWGDVDGDGDLDLAVGNYSFGGRLYRNQLYRNQGGLLTLDQAWNPAPVSTTSLAWGDIDNDGDLDLAVGNLGQSLQIYLNSGRELPSSASLQQNMPDKATSLAWGDVNGDQQLDLVVGRRAANLLLLNRGNGTFQPASWSPTLASTTSVALGDVDNDGDLDLAVGNDQQPNQIYMNKNGSFSDTPDWTATTTTNTQSVAWGLDGVGHMVLAVGNVAPFSNQFYDRHPDGTFAETILDNEPKATYALAWGDMDGDGDLDLVAANRAGTNLDKADASRLYRNCRIHQNDDGCPAQGPGFVRVAAWSPPASYSVALAWGDVDGDGDLDLAIGNSCLSAGSTECYATQLYSNSSGALSLTPLSQHSVDPVSSGGFVIAWGDVDGDGDLDLAVGKRDAPNQIFTNDGNGFKLRQTLDESIPAARGTFSVAWGDVDGDGDLDLAVGNRDAPNEIYRNEGGTLRPAQTLGPMRGTFSVAWGDVDGDGDLDLAVGNDCEYGPPYRCHSNQLYHNQGGPDGQLELDPNWNPAPARTYSVAWGDVDGDGDLDLAVGNRDHPNQLYRNANGTLVLDTTWTSLAVGTRRVAWGDLDGDGDLDLVVGNYNNANQLYRNERGRLLLDQGWNPDATTTFDLAWGDVDGDGDLDLAVANVDDPPQFYRNVRGQLILDRVWSPPSGRSYGLAWGDADGDGDLDLAVANAGSRAAEIYANPRDARSSVAPAPIVHLSRPPADANFYSAPTIFDQPTIPFTYTLSHPDAMPVQGVIGEYSLDGGGNWHPAIATTGTQTTTLPTSSSSITYTYTWDLFASGVFGQSDNVVFRLVAIPAYTNRPADIAGPYLYGSYATNTYPFRVRGTQVKVTSPDHRDGVAGAIVYRLPKDQTSGAEPYADLAGRPFHTDNNGYLQGRGALAVGDRLTALAPISATDTYTLYYTNATPTVTGTAAYTVTQPGVQTLAVSAGHPLLLFNPKVSLEWDARNDPQFLTQLDYDFKRAAEFLYDWTDGQVALGDITIYQAKQHWDDAHIRIYATNRLRPNANKGGVVAIERTDPLSPTVTYAPGQLRIGAVWNRYGDSSGALGEDWPRTLAHELGHYALYLDDDYIGLNDQGVLVPVESCAGTAMADPYRDDYSEFHSNAGWLAECSQTLSNQETGRSDWATIKALYPALNTPDELSNHNPGPRVLPLNVTRVRFVDPPATKPDDTLAAPIFLLSRAEDGARYQPSASARAFLFQRAPGTDVISDVVDLGRPTLDRVLARGARPGDRLCVYDLGARDLDLVTGRATAAPRLGCEDPVSATDQQLSLALFDGRSPRFAWQPDLSVAPVTSTTLAISVTNVPDGLALHARLFPSFGLMATATLSQSLVPGPEGTYSSIFELGQPAFAGYVYIWVEEGAPRREIVSDVTLIGSPAAGWGRGAPRGNPAAGWGRGAPIISSDGQVLLFTRDRAIAADQVVSIQATSNITATPSWATPVGSAYRVTTNAPTLQGTSISFSYLGSEVPPGEEPGLRVYFWDAPAGLWQVLNTTLNLKQNNASALVRGPGLYALMSSIVLPIDHAGWNLVAYPAPDHAMPEALGSIDGFYTIVYGYEPGDAADPWKVYDVGVPPEWADLVNDLKRLREGRGYWINATEPITALLKGGADGAALAAAPLSLPPATYYGIAPAAANREGMMVEARVNGVLCGQAPTKTLVLGGQQRVVFVVDVRAAGGGADTGCGTPGQLVTIAFLDGTRQVATITTIWDNNRVHRIQEDAGRIYLPLVRR